ncbi:hypothetical protein [Magnetococcus sp. PR-3]|uniref:hypothetical protein n=1 Tax=Magnetococcus sp. PR-3 TaxID=3120355 RepID=UPI002FCE3211
MLRKNHFLSAFILLSIFLGGCTVPKKVLVDSSVVSSDKTLLMMPMDVELYEIQAGGVQEPKAGWTQQAKQNLDAAIRDYASSRGLRIQTMPTDLAVNASEDMVQMQKLHAQVNQTIFLHNYTAFHLPTKYADPDWVVGDYSKKLKELTGADYGLYLHFRDSFSSSGRWVVLIAAAAAGVHLPGGAQISEASMVDLSNGQVVWHSRLAKESGDLRKADSAAQSIQELMDNYQQQQ